MALFSGKKAKDAPSGPAPDDTTGGSTAVATADAGDAPAKVKRVKVAREPKAPKARKVKNGVAVGLNIGNQYIKAVEVTSKGGELTVTAMGAVPTPPESYTNGNVLSVSALSNAIKDLWRGAGIKSKVAITSVAGTGALVVRVIEVPKMTDGELRDNMKVDADRYIPFPPSEVVMDFKALRDLPSDPDAPNMEVLLAAAQREIIDLHVRVIQGARLDPRAIDVETIAASRTLQLERGNQSYIDYNEVTGVVNLGATGSEISILRGDIVVFTRVVPNGGNSITLAIAEGLQMPFPDAEHLKLVSADALPPAGYGAAAPSDDFGFGDTGADFNFGGDEFSGGDFNSAFEDISADPNSATAGAGSDDPFDLDFFNQGPAQDEPGAGHAQKEGEDDEANAPFSFSFGDEAPAAPPTTPTPAPAVPAASTPPTPAPGISFDFGDDLSEEYLPTLVEPDSQSTPATPISTDKGTAQLNDFSLDATDTTPLPSVTETPVISPAVQTPQPSLSESFASLIPSAFDFDNFDLPGIQEEGLSTVSTPIAPPAATAPPAPLVDVTPVTPPPPAPSDALPASFGFEDDSLASKHGEESAQPVTFGFDAPVEPAAEPAPLSFEVEPEPAVPAPVIAEVAPVIEEAPVVEEAPAFEDVPVAFEADGPAPDADIPPVAAPAVTVPVVAAPAAADEDFDLDSIFGDSPAAEADPFGASASAGQGGTAMPSNDFDLEGLETGLGSFAGTFGGQTDDFSTFGTGLADDAVETDAATLYSLIQPSLEELSSEVRRSLEFHLGRYPDATISRLVLLGGGAKLRNIDVFFTQSLGVPTVVANPFAHIAVQAPKLPPGYAIENGPLCAVALGLALRDFVD